MEHPIVPAVAAAVLGADVRTMADAGRVADAAARLHVLEEHNEAKAANTTLAQRSDLDAFAAFLRCVVGLGDAPTGLRLHTDVESWRGVTYGLVKGFRAWLEREGYAVGTIRRRLATVRKFATLAFEAGVIDEGQHAQIRLVHGPNRKAAFTLDIKRQAAGVPTRVGAKKAAHPKLTNEQARMLKRHPDTPLGRRDALLMCLLLDQGLRVGEAVQLVRDDFDLEANTFRLLRTKVQLIQVHGMTPDTRRALQRWIDAGECPAEGPILRSSYNGGRLRPAGRLSERSASERVRVLGARLGVAHLSAHSCRRFWTRFHRARADRGEVNLLAVKQAGGWATWAMLEEYAGENDVANAGLQVSV